MKLGSRQRLLEGDAAPRLRQQDLALKSTQSSGARSNTRQDWHDAKDGGCCLMHGDVVVGGAAKLIAREGTRENRNRAREQSSKKYGKSIIICCWSATRRGACAIDRVR